MYIYIYIHYYYYYYYYCCIWSHSMTHTHTHFSLFFIFIFPCSSCLLLLLFVLSICLFVLYLSSVLYNFLPFFLSYSSPFIPLSFFLSFFLFRPRSTTHSYTRYPLDEWSAHRRDLHLTTHTFTRDRHPCPRRDSNPQSQQASGRRPTPLGSVIFILILNITPLLPSQKRNQARSKCFRLEVSVDK